jgi:hypothetical protein
MNNVQGLPMVRKGPLRGWKLEGQYVDRIGRKGILGERDNLRWETPFRVPHAASLPGVGQVNLPAPASTPGIDAKEAPDGLSGSVGSVRAVEFHPN